jgi:hypothetical protein
MTAPNITGPAGFTPKTVAKPPMTTVLSRIFLALYLLTFFVGGLISISIANFGGNWAPFAVATILAVGPIVIGPRRYRYYGAVAFLLAAYALFQSYRYL